MIDDDFEFMEAPDGQVIMLQDKPAARVAAYIALVQTARDIKEPELYSEALEMLKRLRLSISIQPETSLGVIKGGKGN